MAHASQEQLLEHDTGRLAVGNMVAGGNSRVWRSTCNDVEENEYPAVAMLRCGDVAH